MLTKELLNPDKYNVFDELIYEITFPEPNGHLVKTLRLYNTLGCDEMSLK